MKNFAKLIKQVYEEKYFSVVKKIIDNKTPVAFLYISPIEKSVELVKNLRSKGWNITNLIVTDNNPPPGQLGF